MAIAGGRGGGPASPATQRVYLSMIRALARQLGRDDATDTRVPRHEPGPPEALTDTDYQNLLRVPDRRTLRGKRDHALLGILGDCGLRAAELRGLRARDLRRPRANGRHHQLYVRGKGGKERAVPVPAETMKALEAWLKVHPLARGVALLDDDELFVRIGRRAHEEPLPLSSEAVYRIVRKHSLAAGIPQRLAHPHALRTYWVTHALESNVPIHEVKAHLGHSDIRTTAAYGAVRPENIGSIADVLDRRHQAARRSGRQR
ncbi:integrase/recombinase XerC [Solirubrobacter pauli]|uniref:Integrase/recombinase XerC n=1 Tax=Solirubrobacter pauli TaxID=166793 RepID=A0A660L897_9ACTN|nr:site-specific integrase [Solirubrobacter pauli]RKQ90485.1 integrase/recombinase XerC [Solirubrobacter pauli]